MRARSDSSWLTETLARLSFSAGMSRLGLTVEAHHFCSEETLVCRMTVPDRDAPDLSNFVVTHTVSVGHARSEEDLLRIVKNAVGGMLAHEVAESLLFDGTRVFDPHDRERIDARVDAIASRLAGRPAEACAMLIEGWVKFSGGLSALEMQMAAWVVDVDAALIVLNVSMRVPNRDYPGQTVTVGQSVSLPYHEGWTKTLLWALRRHVADVVRHELCESVRFDGELVWDPHKDGN